MKLKFDSSLAFQQQAIAAVTRVFEGQPPVPSALTVKCDQGYFAGVTQTELGLANQLLLDDGALFENVRRVQAANGIPPGPALAGRHFTIEMETGTGKTYVYLRTIFELNKLYGFTKFVIVVPSVAIREGVESSLRLMRDHFKSLYAAPFDALTYDAKKPAEMRSFATASAIQVLVINIQAFQKDVKDEVERATLEPEQLRKLNVMNRELDVLGGRRPLEFLQSSRPIVIIDEPQSVEGDTRKAQTPSSRAIERLHPLCTLRYSATHKNPHNLLFRLGPLEAYERRLVKRIEVASVRGAARRAACQGDLDAQMKAQVRETVAQHLKKELLLRGRGIKVLSLFFIDRVSSYREVHADGSGGLGKVGRWFEEAYVELSKAPAYQALASAPVEQVHGGYFAMDKRGAYKDTTGTSADDASAYHLIMQAKEKLLSLEVPLRFIFTHSALREGWDNPNVFQICTLNQTRAADRKRQEIGRGLRLCVNQQGERVHDDDINRLTVIANASYEDFVSALQTEYEQDFGIRLGEGHIERACQPQPGGLQEPQARGAETEVLHHRVGRRTQAPLTFERAELVSVAIAALKAAPAVPEPRAADIAPAPLPDLLGTLQNQTPLTRQTLVEVLVGCGRLAEFQANPHGFTTMAVEALEMAVNALSARGTANASMARVSLSADHTSQM